MFAKSCRKDRSLKVCDVQKLETDFAIHCTYTAGTLFLAVLVKSLSPELPLYPKISVVSCNFYEDLSHYCCADFRLSGKGMLLSNLCRPSLESGGPVAAAARYKSNLAPRPDVTNIRLHSH